MFQAVWGGGEEIQRSFWLNGWDWARRRSSAVHLQERGWKSIRARRKVSAARDHHHLHLHLHLLHSNLHCPLLLANCKSWQKKKAKVAVCLHTLPNFGTSFLRLSSVGKSSQMLPNVCKSWRNLPKILHWIYEYICLQVFPSLIFGIIITSIFSSTFTTSFTVSSALCTPAGAGLCW